MFGFVKKAWNVAKSPVGKMLIKSFIGGGLIAKGMIMVGEASEKAGRFDMYNSLVDGIVNDVRSKDGVSYWTLEKYDKWGRPSGDVLRCGTVDEEGKVMQDYVQRYKDEATEETAAEPSV